MIRLSDTIRTQGQNVGLLQKKLSSQEGMAFFFSFLLLCLYFFLTSLGLHCDSSLVAYRCSIKHVYLPQIRRLLETLVSHKDELTG